VSLVTAIAAGIVPAITASQPKLGHALKEGNRGAGGRRSRFSNALLVMQAALSVVLLVGAGLFVRSLQSVRGLDLGFDAERLVFASVSLDEPSPVGSAAIRRDGLSQLAARLAELPGVEHVALASMIPMYGYTTIDLFLPHRDSLPPIPGGFSTATGISPAYFSAAGIRLVQGRDFSRDDKVGTAPVLVVSQSLARAFWPHSSALGQCVHLVKRTSPCFTVVGVSEDVRRLNVVEEQTAQYYLPLAQAPAESGVEASVVVIRVPPEQSSLVAQEARRTIKQIFPGGEAVVRQMSEILASQYRPWRMGAMLFSLFGALALVVAAVGVYSTVTYNVGQRTHEMGIRMALGGRAADLVRLVLGEGLRVAAIGIALGGAVALVSGRLLASLLYGISPRDPAVLAAVALTLFGITAIACLLPAVRAARVDPVTALRSE
jgi:predicted permease